jgi:hypothetical protein
MAYLINRTVFTEHFALHSPLSLEAMCGRIRACLNLPDFQFDCENETEWGLVEVDNLEYNVSRPYEEGTLQEWDSTAPAECNFGISLAVYREHPQANNYEWWFDEFIAPVVQQIADELNVSVYYHRTWRGAGNNVERNQCFRPRFSVR